MRTGRDEILLASLLTLAWIHAGCLASAPSFPEIPGWDDPMIRTSELSAEEKRLWVIADEALAELADDDELVEDARLDAYLAEVVAEVWSQPPEPAPSIRVIVVESAERNAFAWPNGLILISSGLLATLENEAQLAYLIGHETAHILGRHSLQAERYELITGSHVDRMRLSKYVESEADRMGFEVFVLAGYAPIESIRMMRHLDDGSAPPVDRIRAWESHVDLDQRIEVLRRTIRLESVGGRRIGAERFLAAIDEIRLGVVELEIEARAYDVARARIDEHLQRVPASGRAHFLRAEITRLVSAEGKWDRAVREDYERAIELAPEGADALRALGLLLRGTDEQIQSDVLLARYLEVRPDAIDRKLIARYLGRGAPADLPKPIEVPASGAAP